MEWNENEQRTDKPIRTAAKFVNANENILWARPTNSFQGWLFFSSHHERRTTAKKANMKSIFSWFALQNVCCVRGLVSLLCCCCWMSEICHFCFSVSSLAPLLFKQNSFEILANANRLEFRAIKNRFMWRFDSKGPHTLTHLQIFAVTGTAFFCHTLTGLPIE